MARIVFINTVLLFFIFTAQAQWRSHKGNNPFDGGFRSAYVTSPELEGRGKGIFTVDLWNEDDLDVYIKGIEMGECKDVTVEVNFDEDKYIYEVMGSKVENDQTVIYGDYLISVTPADTIMMYDLINKLRSSDSYWVRIRNNCTGFKYTYKFSLTGSSNAINFVLDQRQIKKLREESDRLANAIQLYRASNELLSRSDSFKDIILRSTVTKHIEQFFNCPVCQPLVLKNEPGDSVYILNHYANGKTLVQLGADGSQYYIPNAAEHIEGDMEMKAMLVAIKNRWTD